MRRSRFVVLALALACLALWPAVARAQSAIAGVVKDTSGAVLPGVTVEVASHALIEKTRSATTDGQGQYKIIDLRPGVYIVTFTLPGFSSVKRDGLELPSNFTATVNADLKVGALEETVNVSGQSPVVDVQNAVQQVVMTRQVLDAVPTGRSIPTLGAMLPGARLALPDVGGTSGMQNRDLTVHGSDGRDTTFQVDGMTLNGIEGDGSVQSYFNEAMFEEISYQTSAINAEVSAGGVRANMIPRDGGNVFKGTIFFSGANKSLQSRQFCRRQEGKASRRLTRSTKCGTSTSPKAGRSKRIASGFSRPIATGACINTSPTVSSRTAIRPIDDASIRSGVVRLTTTFNQKHKIAAYLDRIRKFRGHENSAPAGYAIAGEATDIRAPKQYYTTEGKWTGTLSSKLLLEAGYAINNESYSLTPEDASSSSIPRRDTTLQTAFSAYDGGVYYREPIRRTFATSASYVTGSHAFKAGFQYGWGYFLRQRREVADLIQLYETGVPSQVIIHNTPQSSLQLNECGPGHLRAGLVDTRDGFTINPGVRFEHFNSSIEATRRRRGPVRSGPAVRLAIRCAELERCVAALWFRVGRQWATARPRSKCGIGKYVRAYSTGFADAYDPNFYTSATLTWNDAEQGRSSRRARSIPADGTRARCVYLTPAAKSTSRRCRQPSASSRRRILRQGHQAAVSDRDQRQHAARNHPGHLGDLQLLPSRLQEPDLVRQHPDRSVGLHAVQYSRSAQR